MIDHLVEFAVEMIYIMHELVIDHRALVAGVAHHVGGVGGFVVELVVQLDLHGFKVLFRGIPDPREPDQVPRFLVDPEARLAMVVDGGRVARHEIVLRQLVQIGQQGVLPQIGLGSTGAEGLELPVDGLDRGRKVLVLVGVGPDGLEGVVEDQAQQVLNEDGEILALALRPERLWENGRVLADGVARGHDGAVLILDVRIRHHKPIVLLVLVVVVVVRLVVLIL